MMSGGFTGFSTIALVANPAKTVSLTLGNNNILSGQTMTVDAPPRHRPRPSRSMRRG